MAWSWWQRKDFCQTIIPIELDLGGYYLPGRSGRIWPGSMGKWYELHFPSKLVKKILYLHCILILSMHKNNYTPWHIKIYMYVVQMHIKSDVKSFEVRVYQGFTRFSALFRQYDFHCRGV